MNKIISLWRALFGKQPPLATRRKLRAWIEELEDYQRATRAYSQMENPPRAMAPRLASPELAKAIEQ